MYFKPSLQHPTVSIKFNDEKEPHFQASPMEDQFYRKIILLHCLNSLCHKTTERCVRKLLVVARKTPPRHPPVLKEHFLSDIRSSLKCAYMEMKKTHCLSCWNNISLCLYTYMSEAGAREFQYSVGRAQVSCKCNNTEDYY